MATNQYDAIVIGTGATGGFAAKELAERGLHVIALEAGPAHDEARFQQIGGMKPPRALERMLSGIKGQHVQARASWFSPDKDFLFVNDLKNPYTNSGEHYLWVRGRQVGGRFQTWGRVALRMSDVDFKAASMDGIGEDWPISYADLEPYYDHVEKFLGIIGAPAGIPNLPDGTFASRAGESQLERQFRETVQAKWPERKFTPWRYVQKDATCPDANGEKHITSPIAAGLASGRLTLQPDAVVKCINTDASTGKATGVTYIDRTTKQEHHIEANVVVVCASTIESVRILLNSTSSRHPNGLGNTNGVLGRYFMDQVNGMVFGTVPGSFGWEGVDSQSPADNHGGFLIPRFQNLNGVTHPEFARGYNIQGMAGRIGVPEHVPSLFGMTAQGEMLPSYDNCISLHRSKKDAWGVPVADVCIAMSENERKMLRNQMDTMKEMVVSNGWNIEMAASALGLENPETLMPHDNWFERLMFRLSYRKSIGLGSAIHECGGARMGSDPANSVVNAQNQCWDAENVFVTDSSCFVTNGSVGPTLTGMALTTRACEFIAGQYSGTSQFALAG
ncbi:GMC family oxidoreductase [Parahaliea maris]|uniref:GMC family oxidoreductase n=1 Tax=Parahaliea maris TaxID=2716870 RepID=A0A5C8ZWD3_9GAMM|nr:GMC family oxidoreductase [Parahaliea maris]TXS91870.1 GMC family oxidoreductase [Parahaliea maris]